jgi:glycosyltransferase involved in cell wall biosynthesis
LKIGFFYVPYYPLSTGRSVHGYKLVEALKKRGHQVLSCLGDGNPDCMQYERTKRGALQLAKDADVLYIRVAGMPLYSFLEKSTLLKLVRPYSLPVVWEVNAPVEELKATFPQGAERDALIRSENRKRRFLARLVDAGIGVSDVLSTYIRDFLGIQKTFTIPNGSDPALFAPGHLQETALSNLQDKFKVCWAGNAENPWQGIDTIVETARRMQKIDPGVIFIVITGNSLWKFPVLKNLLVLRQIPYADLPHYLAAVDVCLCLYKSYDWSEWGFYNSPLKLFDYLAAGKPVIASRGGQISQVVKSGVNGMLIDGTVEMVIDSIIELKASKEKRVLLGDNGRNDVINFYNWDRVAEQTENVLRDVSKS